MQPVEQPFETQPSRCLSRPLNCSAVHCGSGFRACQIAEATTLLGAEPPLSTKLGQVIDSMQRPSDCHFGFSISVLISFCDEVFSVSCVTVLEI
jgi:hypothetical protein